MASLPSGDFSSRLPFLFMGVFFSYATYVQINDPDKWVWVCLYGAAAVASLAAVAGARTLAAFLSIIAVGGAVNLLISRILTPPGCEMGEKLIDLPNGFQLSVDVNTEIGRENAGLLIVLGWNLIGAVSLGSASFSAGVTVALLAVAGAILASAVVVPTFLMSPDKIKDYPHCSGLGLGVPSAPGAVGVE